MPRPKASFHRRLTKTRAVSGLSRLAIQRARSRRVCLVEAAPSPPAPLPPGESGEGTRNPGIAGWATVAGVVEPVAARQQCGRCAARSASKRASKAWPHPPWPARLPIWQPVGAGRPVRRPFCGSGPRATLLAWRFASLPRPSKPPARRRAALWADRRRPSLPIFAGRSQLRRFRGIRRLGSGQFLVDPLQFGRLLGRRQLGLVLPADGLLAHVGEERGEAVKVLRA